jgi:hypothetical protein
MRCGRVSAKVFVKAAVVAIGGGVVAAMRAGPSGAIPEPPHLSAKQVR